MTCIAYGYAITLYAISQRNYATINIILFHRSLRTKLRISRIASTLVGLASGLVSGIGAERYETITARFRHPLAEK